MLHPSRMVQGRNYAITRCRVTALKAMDYEPSAPFVTSVLELKLDVNTMFEWQKYSQDTTDVPHYRKLLEFINLRAQASEAPTLTQSQTKTSTRPVANHSASADDANTNCSLCKNDKHPFYVCTRFKALTHYRMLGYNKMCMNCLTPGHFVKKCRSIHRCRKCRNLITHCSMWMVIQHLRKGLRPLLLGLNPHQNWLVHTLLQA